MTAHIRPELDVHHWVFQPRKRPGEYETVVVRWGDRREVQVTVSPTGRNVHVHVDGTAWAPEDDR